MNVWLQLVVSNIVVASLIALLAWQVGRSGRQAMLAHVLWLAFFIKLITPPIVLLPIDVPEHWFPAAPAYTSTFSYLGSTSEPYVTAPLRAATPSIGSTRDTLASISNSSLLTRHFNLWTCLSCLWFLGFTVILIRGLEIFKIDAQVHLFANDVRSARTDRKMHIMPCGQQYLN